MARLSFFLLACLVVIAVASATEEDKETSDLTQTNVDVLERVSRDADPRRRGRQRKGNKGRKGGKKGKGLRPRKAKKARKSKRKERKVGKGTKKGASKNKNKKNKGPGRRNKKAGRKTKKPKGSRSSCRQVATDDACITNICEAWKIRNGAVRNFIRQTKRMVNHAAISEKKLAKKAEFASDAATLTAVLGGNASAPSCALEGSGSGAAEAALGLAACNADIVSSCPPIEVNTNFTGDGGCNKTMFDFKAKVEGCGEGADAASCACYAEAVAMKADVMACAKEAKTLMQDVKAKKDVCKKTFAACKSIQDESVGFAATCHVGGVHGKMTTGMMATAGARRNRILRQLMEQNMKRQAKLTL